MLTAIHNRPFLVFSLAFAAGIALSAGGVTLAFAFALLVIGASGYAAAHLIRGGSGYTVAQARPIVAILALAACGVGCGALRYAAAVITPATDASRFAGGRLVTVEGTVDADPQRLPGRVTFTIRAARVVVGDGAAAVTGLVFATELLRDGARAVPIDYGDRIRARGILELPRPPGNPGAFSWKDYLSHRGIRSQLLIRHPQSLEVDGRGRSFSILSFAVGIRDRIVQAVQRNVREPEAGVLLGILIGRRTEVPPDLMADFVHTGTVHILASAGLHVGILTLCLMWLARKTTLPRKLSLVLLIAVLAAYAVICGGRPSVTRAVIMAAVYLGGIVLEREPDVPTSLGVAGFAILAWQPTALLEAGFQLSFLTVSTLAICMPVWDGLVERFLPFSRHPARRAAVWALDIVGVSLFAQIGSAPIVASAYNEISLGGIIANLLVVPWLFALIPLAVAALAVGLIWPAAGASLLTPCAAISRVIIGIVRRCGESDWSFRAVPDPSALAMAAYYGAVFVGAVYVARQLAKKPKADTEL